MKKSIIVLLIFGTIAFLSFLYFTNSDTSISKSDELTLVWSDDFNYTGLPDSSKWEYDTAGNKDGWGNYEEQLYTVAKPENAFVKNGKLFITALYKPIGEKNFTSARLISKGEIDWSHRDRGSTLGNARRMVV